MEIIQFIHLAHSRGIVRDPEGDNIAVFASMNTRNVICAQIMN